MMREQVRDLELFGGGLLAEDGSRHKRGDRR